MFFFCIFEVVPFVVMEGGQRPLVWDSGTGGESEGGGEARVFPPISQHASGCAVCDWLGKLLEVQAGR